jgi:hypothetical protein
LDSPFKLSSVGFNRVNPPLQIKGLSGKWYSHQYSLNLMYIHVWKSRLVTKFVVLLKRSEKFI